LVIAFVATANAGTREDVDIAKAQAAADAPRANSLAKVVTTAETYQGIPIGFTAEGAPSRGSAGAAITLVEYTDYLCPFCGGYFRDTLPVILDKYVRSGQVRFVIQDFPLASLHPTAPQGAIAAQCVAEQGASKFWSMHDALLGNQQQWARLPDPTIFLNQTARKIGVDMKKYEACLSSGRAEARVQKSIAAAQALGFNATPTFQFVNQATGKTFSMSGAESVEVFSLWLDSMLAGKEPPQAKAADKPQLPAWAKAEGLMPDPARPGYTISGDPYRGNPNAKLVLVEFTDFECPACKRHAADTTAMVEKDFIETGKVLWIVKHFPLRMHPRAPIAAAAAECAGRQGRFWSMHDVLFDRVEQWSGNADPDSIFADFAANLELDKGKFSACLAGRNALEHVLRDIYDGQSIGVKNIPAFALLRGESGTMVVGARNAEQFATVLRERLDAEFADSKKAEAAQ
jgi:protein-disulfide isomerase